MTNRGWQGYYNNYYFRSILELSYIHYLIVNNINFKSAENKEFRIPYIYRKKKKYYYPDFYLIDTEEIIEIKPSVKLNDKINIIKFEEAKKIYGNKYKIITELDINKIDLQTCYNLYKNGEIKFNKRIENRFKKYYNKRKDKI